MRLTRQRLLAVIIAALVHGGAGAAELAPKEISDAMKLYKTKCAKCHKFYEPSAYQDKEWADWMTKMSRKSRLKREQEELLTRYLETVRAGKTNAAPARP